MSNPDHQKARAYFARLLSRTYGRKDVQVVIISHLVDSAVPFLPTIGEYFTIRAVYAKRNSIQPEVQALLEAAMPGVPIVRLDRKIFRDDPAHFVREVFQDQAPVSDTPVILVDIGGYFAESTSGPTEISKELAQRGYRLAGIVEDTQNGHKRYELAFGSKSGEPEIPVYSVALSPLKKPENHLVGVAVTFSIEAILRQSNIVLQSRRCGVIGFGPIGRSVAHSLRNRGLPVRVCEVDPIRLAQAAAQGFHVHDYDDDFISFTHDLNLIVSATGAGAHSNGLDSIGGLRSLDELVKPSRLNVSRRLALNADTIRFLEQDAFIASVTSADDELAIDEILGEYDEIPVSYNEDIVRLVEKTNPASFTAHRTPHSLFLLLRGNAVNFKHQGVVGPAIQLLQGEIISCMQAILNESPRLAESDNVAVRELDNDLRRDVANIWLDQYLVENMMRG